MEVNVLPAYSVCSDSMPGKCVAGGSVDMVVSRSLDLSLMNPPKSGAMSDHTK